MNRIQGFTLSEVIVVIAVLALVFTMAMPDMNRLFARQSEITEELRMAKIQEALDVYAKENKTLPANGGGNWASELAKYSDLSAEQILYDVWNINLPAASKNERSYEMFTNSVSYLGGSYNVYYAVVHSSGFDKTFDETTPTDVSDFTTFDVEAVDDYAVKYTDQYYKIELLEETLRRMETLSNALARYARIKQIHAINNYADGADLFIYFPKDARGGDNGDYYEDGTNVVLGDLNGDGDTSDTGEEVTLSLTTTEGVATIATANQATALATILGLPSYYGEDALTETTMWYISNPGANSTNICGGGVNEEPREDAPFYPPIIMVDATGNPC